MEEGQTSDDAAILRLYVAGSTRRSRQTIESIRELCKDRLAGQYRLEVVDISQEPWRAERENILATPALVRELSGELRKVIGDLMDHDSVVMALELDDGG